jgi:hypothetical protein
MSLAKRFKSIVSFTKEVKRKNGSPAYSIQKKDRMAKLPSGQEEEKESMTFTEQEPVAGN